PPFGKPEHVPVRVRDSRILIDTDNWVLILGPPRCVLPPSVFPTRCRPDIRVEFNYGVKFGNRSFVELHKLLELVVTHRPAPGNHVLKVAIYHAVRPRAVILGCEVLPRQKVPHLFLTTDVARLLSVVSDGVPGYIQQTRYLCWREVV